ncbi:MAG: exodeoxyribonuclease VII small subunit [Pseudomonadales bacterium]
MIESLEMAGGTKKPDFESSLGELEQIVEQLEQGDLSLEQSLAAFEQGVKLTNLCQDALSKAEQKVQILLANQLEPLDTNILDTDDA